jgi:hypothetical protein
MGRIAVVQEGMYGYALDHVLFARVLAEVMTSVAGLVAALVDCGLLPFLGDMDSFDLGEVVTQGTEADVLTTSRRLWWTCLVRADEEVGWRDGGSADD